VALENGGGSRGGIRIGSRGGERLQAICHSQFLHLSTDMASRSEILRMCEGRDAIDGVMSCHAMQRLDTFAGNNGLSLAVAV